jgi:hypothetical protein
VARGKKDNKPGTRDSKRTLLPTFDAEDLAKEIELEGRGPTPFDPLAYARIVGERPMLGGDVQSRRTIPAPASVGEVPPGAPPNAVTAFPRQPPGRQARAEEPTMREGDHPDVLGRRMYGFYLASDYPSALALAELLLVSQPDHALAHLVAEQCRTILSPTSSGTVLQLGSVLRLKEGVHALELDSKSSLVLGHVDGVSDAATVAAASGLSDAEAFEQLTALLDLGVLEVVGY